MKKLLLFAILMAFLMAYSQDVIVTKKSEKINVEILEVGSTEIKYKKTDHPTGPSHSILKSDVASIIYQNGTVDVFDVAPANNTQLVYIKPYPGVPSTKEDYRKMKTMRNAGIGLFAGGLAFNVIMTSISYSGSVEMPMAVGFIGTAAWITGAVLWGVGNKKMKQINANNPNGFTFYETEKIQLNITGSGNNVGLSLNF